MSSLFSYELDEAKIRLTLQNSRAVDYTESNWDDFETNYGQACSGQTHSKFKLPEFHLNINRNIVLPVVFIAALVGVSAIMLSFVDFKTNTPSQVEKSLIPNPDNYKSEQTKTAVVVKKEEVKPQVQKPIIKPDSVPSKAETPVLTSTQVASVASPVNQTNTQIQNTTARMAAVDTAQTSKTDNLTIINPNAQTRTGQKRKRRRKVPTEQIETIKAPSILSPQEASAKEPELELKLN